MIEQRTESAFWLVLASSPPFSGWMEETGKGCITSPNSSLVSFSCSCVWRFCERTAPLGAQGPPQVEGISSSVLRTDGLVTLFTQWRDRAPGACSSHHSLGGAAHEQHLPACSASNPLLVNTPLVPFALYIWEKQVFVLIELPLTRG